MSTTKKASTRSGEEEVETTDVTISDPNRLPDSGYPPGDRSEDSSDTRYEADGWLPWGHPDNADNPANAEPETLKTKKGEKQTLKEKEGL
jgi:hypothetical protein